MKVYVKVKANSGMQKVESFGDWRYLVYVKAPPENGKANAEMLNILAKYLGVPPLKLKIKTGFSNANKILEITD